MMNAMTCITLVLGVFFTCINIASGDANALSLFSRHANKRMSSLNAGHHDNLTVGACALKCKEERSFRCKSFSYDNVRQTCLLYSVDVNDRDVILIDCPDIDHYNTAYVRLFQRLPKHRIPSPAASRQPLDGVGTVEECSMRCLLVDRCCGFNFRNARISVSCTLVTVCNATSVAVIASDDSDYYWRHTDDVLSSFINYGVGILRPNNSNSVYQKVVPRITLYQCAVQCKNASTFHCTSLDFIFTSATFGECRLSAYVAANVGGLVVDSTQPPQNHYELAERFVSLFYVVPYSLLPGHNVKVYNDVSTEQCAELCIRENSMVCRSFDYHVKSGGECKLSEDTRLDADSGLDTDAGLLLGVHHFEMKPWSDCGGNLTTDTGDVASPNWPLNYAHHQHCIWDITVSKHKIIKLQFNYLSLWGSTSSERTQCTNIGDQLLIEEPSSDVKPYCATSSNKLITTKLNRLRMTFATNSHGDSQGFRAFYSAEWPCDMNFDEAPGEIASPRWPERYPPNTRCTWRLIAPEGHRVRIVFSDFNLDRHSLGHCNDRVDNVRLLDGSSLSSAPLIGVYCGQKAHSTETLSTSRDLLVQFRSDRHSNPDDHSSAIRQRQGFHAVFYFEPANGSISDYGGPFESSRYIDVSSGRRGVQILEKDEPRSADRYVSDPSEEASLKLSDTEANHGRRSIWAVISLLLVLSLSLGVMLFLVSHYYRQKLMGRREDVIERQQQAHVLEDIPLRTVHSATVSFSTVRKPQHFNNIVELSSNPSECSSTPIYEQCGPPVQPIPRPRSCYGKFHLDKVKNTNVNNETMTTEA